MMGDAMDLEPEFDGPYEVVMAAKAYRDALRVLTEAMARYEADKIPLLPDSYGRPPLWSREQTELVGRIRLGWQWVEKAAAEYEAVYAQLYKGRRR